MKRSLFYTYWDLPTRKRSGKIRMKYATNQSESRTTVSVNRSSNQRRERFYITMVSEDTHADEKTRVSWPEWKNGGGDATIRSPRGGSGWLYRWPRKQKHPSEDRIILLKTFLQTTGECRNVEEIPPAKLEEFWASSYLLCKQRREKTISRHLSERLLPALSGILKEKIGS